MKVLVLTGPESSGKSWLSAEIQNRFGGLLVGEYVRHFIDQQGRDTHYADIPAIARGQLDWEDTARASEPHLLILDTHLLSNVLWSRTLFGDCPAWIEQQLLNRSSDLAPAAVARGRGLDQRRATLPAAVARTPGLLRQQPGMAGPPSAGL